MPVIISINKFSLYNFHIYTFALYFKKVYIASNYARFIHHYSQKLKFSNCTIVSIVLESVVERDNLGMLYGSFS